MTTKRKYYPGMFDLIKGYGMITIILVHVYSVFPTDLIPGTNPSIPVKIAFISVWTLCFKSALMPLFFMISGFGFSATSMRKCIKKQAKTLLKPYFLTGIFVMLVHFCAHYAAFRYLPGSIEATARIVLSHLLGISQSTSIFGIGLHNIGSVWFILALFFSWIFYNAITQYVKERYRSIAVLAVVCIGYVVGNSLTVPFCLTQGCIGVGYIHVGQLIRKHDLLFRKLPISAWCGIILPSLASFVFGEVNMAHSLWKLGLIDIAGAGCMAFLLARVNVLLNDYDNPVVNTLRKIGRYSLWIMCVHTIDGQGLLWYLYVEKFSQHPWATFGAMLVIRFCLIFVVCKVVSLCNKKMIKHRRRLKSRQL